MKINHILEREEILLYLKSRMLLKQYKKAKKYLLAGKNQQVDFKERQPKKSGVWYFRINKQYRAIGYIDSDNDFIVAEIDNHQ